MRIVADSCVAHELKSGQLFSTADQEEFDVDLIRIREGEPVVGIKVYIRTETPCPEDQAMDRVYRVRIYDDSGKEISNGRGDEGGNVSG